MSTMKAVRIHAYGGADALIYEEAPRPSAGPGEVLIRVEATSVNPFDCFVHAGYAQSYFNYTLPLIPGEDVSGTIEAVGPGVAGAEPGQAVYARGGVIRDGAYAEFVVVPASDVADKPATLDHIHAAALPHVCLTAWQAFSEAALGPGQTVLIHAAAGGVGHVAVQLARLRGARVIGTASTNLDLLQELGVDQAINYATTPFEQAVSGVDVVLDLVGGDTQERSWAVLKPGGILVSTVQAPSEEKAAAHGVRHAFVTTAPPIGRVLTEVARMVGEGQIRPVVSAIYPLAEIQAAHQHIERGHTRGKIGVQVAP